MGEDMKDCLMDNTRWLVAVLCWVTLLFSSGVSFGESNEEVLVLEPDSEGIQRASIVLDSYAYTPSHISIQAGKPVEFHLENQSILTPHNFIMDHPDAGLQQDINVDAGDDVTIRFVAPVPGTYTFYCDKQLLFFPSHREEGMEGLLEVRP